MVGTVWEPNVVPGTVNRFVVPPRVAVTMFVVPVTVRVTFVPATAEGTDAVMLAAPSIVKVAFAVSVGVVIVSFTVYVPAATVGTVNV